MKECIQCNLCTKNCDMLRDFNVEPKEVSQGIEQGKHVEFSCNICGLCKEVCPKDIDLGEKILEFRKKNFKINKDRMKGVRNFQKWTASSLFTSKANSGYEVVFLPGCSLASHDRNILKSVREYLENNIGRTQVLVDCCGKPAKVIGDVELYNETFNKYVKAIKRTHAQRVITACGNCYNILKEKTDIDVELLWNVFKINGVPGDKNEELIRDKRFVLHDPCSFRGNDRVHEDIRWVLDQLKVEYKELDYNKNKTKCCGAGGMVGMINRDYAVTTMKRRVKEGGNREIICYCQSCVEAFISSGGQAINLLDIIFGNEKHIIKASKTNKGSIKRWSNRIKNKKI